MLVEQKETLTIFGADRLELLSAWPFNVIVAGASRGGTSAVAAVMRALGLNMGENLHPTTHEDIDFADLMNYGITDFKRWELLVREKVSRYPGWSLKLPGALSMLGAFEATLPNPLYIIVTRNAFSVARSLVMRDENYGNGMFDYLRGYDHAVSMYADCFREIGMTKGAFAVCEYEVIMAKPAVFVREFAEICFLDPKPAELQSAKALITSAGYKSLEDAAVLTSQESNKL